ncbi:MAG TPA: Xaa-Pro peptidase family protein [Vicinamibacterales bacterium]|nr:Xaa-Pro peptidase family protein [Vicinamibacterales bacterium]
MTDPRHDWPARLAALRHRWMNAADEAPRQACVISSAVNISYLTGFRGSAGLLVQSEERDLLLLDGRYIAVATEARDRGELAPVSIERVEKSYDQTLSEILGRLGALHLCFESDHVTVSELNRWQAAIPGEWHGLPGLVEALRVIKDAAEIAILRRAGVALVGVASRLVEWVAVDRTEREVAGDINRGLERAGFERPAFDTIVAAGPNSAHPHARPGDRRLADADLVVLDFGGVLDGYCVDLTRMAAVGRLPDEAGRIYRAVRNAQQAALNVICAGVTAGAVDAAARQVLDTEGLGAAFVHGTGHGLGLEVHEAPRLSSQVGATERLRAGMVCTIEPGAYVAGVGGVRLEDDVLVTDTGAELLTPGPRDLLTV